MENVKLTWTGGQKNNDTLVIQVAYSLHERQTDRETHGSIKAHVTEANQLMFSFNY